MFCMKLDANRTKQKKTTKQKPILISSSFSNRSLDSIELHGSILPSQQNRCDEVQPPLQEWIVLGHQESLHALVCVAADLLSTIKLSTGSHNHAYIDFLFPKQLLSFSALEGTVCLFN